MPYATITFLIQTSDYEIKCPEPNCSESSKITSCDLSVPEHLIFRYLLANATQGVLFSITPALFEIYPLAPYVSVIIHGPFRYFEVHFFFSFNI
jgi:hypothetical protein